MQPGALCPVAQKENKWTDNLELLALFLSPYCKMQETTQFLYSPG